VDPAEASVEVLRLSGAAYVPAGWFTGAGVARSPTFPDLALPLARVFS
jgi:hypothetical protein